MIKVFLSHSSKEVYLVEPLIDLLRSALNLNSNEIRCTSVGGYRLPSGAVTDDQLRQEVLGAATFVGLLSRSSLRSTYVLFELGALWGAGKSLVPLLAPNIKAAELRPPLSNLNALRCDNRSHLHQLIYDLGAGLNQPIGNPAAYEKYVQRVLDSAVEFISIRQPGDGEQAPLRPIVEGDVRDPEAKVWVIVHPVGNPNYWVQPKVSVKETGKWKTQIYIGRVGSEDVGARFEVAAIANPDASLKEGDILNEWPPAEWTSKIIDLVRI